MAILGTGTTSSYAGFPMKYNFATGLEAHPPPRSKVVERAETDRSGGRARIGFELHRDALLLPSGYAVARTRGNRCAAIVSKPRDPLGWAGDPLESASVRGNSARYERLIFGAIAKLRKRAPRYG
jgi:hypothetical protein